VRSRTRRIVQPATLCKRVPGCLICPSCKPSGHEILRCPGMPYGVGVGVSVSAGVGVRVEAGVLVGVSVGGTGVGVIVGGTGVGVAVGGTGVGVAVGGTGVGVAVGVGVGVGQSPIRCHQNLMRALPVPS